MPWDDSTEQLAGGVAWRPWTYLGGERRIALVDLAQAIKHFGQLRGVNWLHSNLDNRCGVEFQGSENLSLRSKNRGVREGLRGRQEGTGLREKLKF